MSDPTTPAAASEDPSRNTRYDLEAILLEPSGATSRIDLSTQDLEDVLGVSPNADIRSTLITDPRLVMFYAAYPSAVEPTNFIAQRLVTGLVPPQAISGPAVILATFPAETTTGFQSLNDETRAAALEMIRANLDAVPLPPDVELDSDPRPSGRR